MADTTRYSGTQILLHWLMAALVGTNYIVSDGMERALDARLEGEGVVSGLTPTVHVYVGLAVLALVLIRLLVRVTNGAPAMAEGTPAPLHLAGVWTHRALYLLLFLVPTLGAVAWYGGYDEFAEYHVIAMNIMMILAGLHAAAALFHQFVLKDGLLVRMLRP